MKQNTRENFKIAGWVLLTLLLAAPLYQYLGTRFASADREIFENSKPFTHGMIENLNRLRLEYSLTDNQNHKDAIRLMVVSQVANLDKSKLSQDLQLWIKTL